MKKGIDASQFNGEIDWKKVKENGAVDFAILRSGFGWTDGDISLRRDRMFERNVKGCEEAGIPYAVECVWVLRATLGIYKNVQALSGAVNVLCI